MAPYPFRPLPSALRLGCVLIGPGRLCLLCRSALDMDDAMMDAYMEFCEKALLPREDRMPRASCSQSLPVDN